jgi:hypothetical protein
MNIANINWIDIKNKLSVTEDSQIKEYNSKTHFDEDKKKSNGSSKRVYTLELLVPGCLNVFWDKVFQVLASVEPIKIDDSYSPLATMKSIPEIIKTPYGDISKDNYKAIIGILNEIPRSATLPGKASEHPQWSQLVPLWLAAYKHYKDIPYSAWVKDGVIRHMVGVDFYDEILEIPEGFVFDKSKLIDLRHKALTTKVSTAGITSPVRKSFYMTDTWRVKLNSKVAAVYLQIWLANVQVRHPDMILDFDNWDNMPEPYDLELMQINTNTRHIKENKYELPF